jgi:hypothetical protein
MKRMQQHPLSIAGGRGWSLAVTLILVAAGLTWRLPSLGFSPFVAKHGGSILWGAMVFFLIATIRPTPRIATLAIIAVTLTTTVECSQALHIGWLDAIRRQTFGQLLLGRTFSGWDILTYGIGIACAALGVAIVVSRRARVAPNVPA